MTPTPLLLPTHAGHAARRLFDARVSLLRRDVRVLFRRSVAVDRDAKNVRKNSSRAATMRYANAGYQSNRLFRYKIS
ncbi:hypothetical protein J2Z31_003589 [Sinorhizobium kostiense]|uniref:Transposase n=1 Tax=Sinorhizobium kostiense TaxID=76747 RepID=A0ABS4R419_9HYPH|nr:hypothetical protein [Sinorhizobium kostiense]